MPEILVLPGTSPVPQDEEDQELDRSGVLRLPGSAVPSTAGGPQLVARQEFPVARPTTEEGEDITGALDAQRAVQGAAPVVPPIELREVAGPAGPVDVQLPSRAGRKVIAGSRRLAAPGGGLEAVEVGQLEDPYIPAFEEFVAKREDEGLLAEGLNLLEVFDYLGRGTSAAVAQSWAGVLPDPGTRVGDVAREAVGVASDLAGGKSPLTIPTQILTSVPGVEGISNIDRTLNALARAARGIRGGVTGIRDELADLVPDVPGQSPKAQVAKRLYDALASGEIAESARPSQIIPAVPYISGRSVIDLALSKADATRLAEDEPDLAMMYTWKMLSTDPGREVYGMFLEMARDPLWFFGPAKGAQVVHIADESFRVSSGLSRAAQAVARSRGLRGNAARGALEDLARIVHKGAGAEELADLTDDAARARHAAEALVQRTEQFNAMRPKRVLVDTAERIAEHERQLAAALADVGKTAGADTEVRRIREALASLRTLRAQQGTTAGSVSKWVTRNLRRSRLAAAQAQDDARALTGLVEDLRRGKVTSHARPKGWVPTSLGRAMGPDLVPAGAVRKVGKAADWLTPPKMADIEAKVAKAAADGMALPDALTRAELLAWSLGQYPVVKGAAALGQGIVTLPQYVFQGLGTAFRSRFERTLLPAALLRHAQTGVGTPTRVPLLGALVTRVRKAHPKVWAAYERLAVDLANRMNSDPQRLNHLVRNIYDAGNRVLVMRRRLARDPKAVKQAGVAEELAYRWASKDYTVQNVVDEAFDAMERGSGILDERPELQAMLPIVQRTVKDIADTYGKDLATAEQALVQVHRKMRGDPLAFREVVKWLTEADELASALVPNGATIEETAHALRTWEQTNRAVVGALSAVDPRSFARALVKIAEALEGETIHAEEQRKFITAAIARVFMDDPGLEPGPTQFKLAWRVLHHVAEMFGVAVEDAPKALLDGLLAEGVADAAKTEERLAAGVTKFIKEIQGEQAVVAKVLDGTADVVTEAAVLERLLTAQGWRRYIALKGQLGDEWDGFVEAARNGGQEWRRWVASHYSSPDAPKEERLIVGRLYGQYRRRLNLLQGLAQTVIDAREQTVSAAVGLRRMGVMGDFLESVTRKATRALPSSATADEVEKTAAAWLAAARGGGFGTAAQQAAASLAVERARIDTAKSLRDALDTVTPRIVLRGSPNAATPEKTRLFTEWEEGVWQKWRQETQHISPENRLLATFLALRDIPEQVYHDPKYAEAKKLYENVLGQRAGDLPADLVSVVTDARRLINEYEARYAEAGMDFVRGQVGRFVEWGTYGYVPHAPTPTSLTAAGKRAELRQAVAGIIGGGSPGTLERLLDTGLDARKTRSLQGAISELNAMADSAEGLTWTLDPLTIISRYAQANRAIAAKEFLVGLLMSGVGRVFRSTADTASPVLAAAEDYVPLFVRSGVTRDIDLLVSGTKGEWAARGVTPEEIQGALDQVRAWKHTRSGPLAEKSPFASWAGDTPDLRAATTIEERVLAYRAQDVKANSPDLFDPRKLFDGFYNEIVQGVSEPGDRHILEAWKKVAEWMNDPERSMAAGLRGDTDMVSGKMLRDYYSGAGPAWQVYVPASVYHSMASTFNVADKVPGIKKVADKLNNFYKVRYTVINTAFTVRNALWNTFSNILDLGPLGVLNPATQRDASILVAAADFVNRYGSLEGAWKSLSAPRAQFESVTEWTNRKALQNLFVRAGVKGLWETGIDLGDGVLRAGDDAVQTLLRHNVVSGAYSGMADVMRAEETLAETMSMADPTAIGQRLLHGVSVAEDVAIVLASTAMAGPGGLAIALPKGWGRFLARVTEDHGRTMNFLGNMKRTGDVAQASEAVQRFLFNYDDLTAFQKIWMRTLVPFFTWTSKNIELQTRMFFENPIAYSTFHKLFVFNLPSAMDTLDRELRGEAPRDALLTGPASEMTMRLRPDYARAKIRIPLPGHKNAYIEGLGSPVEAYFDTLTNLNNLFNPTRWSLAGDKRPQLRLLSQFHFLARAIVESLIGRNFYYDRPLEELSSARQANQILAGLRAYGHWPVIGDVAELMAGGLEDFLGLNRVLTVDPKTGYTERARAMIVPNHFFTSGNPWRQILGNLTSATDQYAMSLIDDKGPGEVEVTPLPAWFRWVNALTYVGAVQEVPEERQRRIEKAHIDAYLEFLKARGATREAEVWTQRR